jgi:hypothetical protein
MVRKTSKKSTEADDDTEKYIPGRDFGEPVITSSSSPLLQAGIAAIKLHHPPITSREELKKLPQRKTQTQAARVTAMKAFKALQRHRVLVKLLQRPQTSWDKRVEILKELEKQGWSQLSYFRQLKSYGLFAGKEFKVPIETGEYEELYRYI